MNQFELAKDKIMMGAERRSMVMSEAEKRNTAYHEAGHAIVGRLMPEHDPCLQSLDYSAWRALGVTMFLPEEDRYSHSRRHIISQITSLFGGRVAEEMTLGQGRHHHGCIQRHSTCDRGCAQYGDQVGPLGKHGPADVRRGWGRGLSGSQCRTALQGDVR